MGMRFESVLHIFVASRLVIAFVDFKPHLTYATITNMHTARSSPQKS
jgi:hypothetical protein